MNSFQLQLYEDFAKSKAKQDMENSLTEDGERKDKKKGPPHVFQV